MKIKLKTTRKRLYHGITKYEEKACMDAKKRSELKLEATMQLFLEMLGE